MKCGSPVLAGSQSTALTRRRKDRRGCVVALIERRAATGKKAMKAQARQLARNSFAPTIRNSCAFTPEVVPTLNRLRVVSNGMGDWYQRLPRIQNARAGPLQLYCTIIKPRPACQTPPHLVLKPRKFPLQPVSLCRSDRETWETNMSSYHFLFVVRGGKIQQVKVYLYTIHATKYSALEVRHWRDLCPGIRAGSH